MNICTNKAKLLLLLPVITLALFPQLVLAQEISNVQDLINAVGAIISSLIPIVASIALLAFFWGLAKYIFQAGDEEAKERGKRVMIAGIISLFLIAAIGGIIDFIADVLGVDENKNISPPTIMYNGGDGLG